MIGLERRNFLRAPSSRWNNKFYEILSSTGSIERCHNKKTIRINEPTRRCFSSWQRETTHCISGKRKALTIWLVCFLPHPAYSPDLTSSDYYFFLFLKNSLRDKRFKSISEIKAQRNKSAPPGLFLVRNTRILTRRHNEASWEMEEGNRAKGFLYNKINNILNSKHCVFISY